MWGRKKYVGLKERNMWGYKKICGDVKNMWGQKKYVGLKERNMWGCKKYVGM